MEGNGREGWQKKGKQPEIDTGSVIGRKKRAKTWKDKGKTEVYPIGQRILRAGIDQKED